MTRPARSRPSLRRVVAASLTAVGLTLGATLLASPSYAVDEGPVVPGTVVATLNCDATPLGMTLDLTLGEGYQQPSG